MDNRKHRNVGVVRSASGIKQYLTVCQAMDQEYTTLAYPATICMDCQAAEGTDDETSVETPKFSQETLEEEMDGNRSVKSTEIEQVREEFFKGKEAPKKTGAEQLLSSGDVIFQAPMRPLDVARTSYLDYTKTQSIKFYNKGCEKLSGEPFNGKMLLTWLVQVQDKARMFTWIPIMTIKGKLLTQQFADISMEEVREHAQCIFLNDR